MYLEAEILFFFNDFKTKRAGGQEVINKVRDSKNKINIVKLLNLDSKDLVKPRN